MSCDRDDKWCPPPITKPLIAFPARLLARPVRSDPLRIKAKPLNQFILRLKKTIALIQICGVPYKDILDHFQKMLCLLECVGETECVTVLVTDVYGDVRPDVNLARKTTIANLGESGAFIYEDDIIVSYIWPDETWVSPTSGRLNISAVCATSEQTIFEITTESRCDCGVDVSYYDDTVEPVGGGYLM